MHEYWQLSLYLLLLLGLSFLVLCLQVLISLSFFSVSKNSLTFSTMYFDCQVSLTPCAGRLAILCVGSSNEVDDCGRLLSLIPTLK